jgi:hypothetical protein
MKRMSHIVAKVALFSRSVLAARKIDGLLIITVMFGLFAAPLQGIATTNFFYFSPTILSAGADIKAKDKAGEELVI